MLLIIRFALIVPVILMVIISQISFSASAIGIMVPRAYIPNVDKRYPPPPPPPPSIIIDYVPALSLPQIERGMPIEPYFIRGHIVDIEGKLRNPDGSQKYYVVYYYFVSEYPEYGWAISLGTFLERDASFSLLLQGFELKANLIRFYLVRSGGKLILPSHGRNSVLIPDPPTEDIFALVEISREWPDKWSVTLIRP